MCNLKTFFLRNFSGVLHDSLPQLFKRVFSLYKKKNTEKLLEMVFLATFTKVN